MDRLQFLKAFSVLGTPLKGLFITLVIWHKPFYDWIKYNSDGVSQANPSHCKIVSRLEYRNHQMFSGLCELYYLFWSWDFSDNKVNWGYLHHLWLEYDSTLIVSAYISINLIFWGHRNGLRNCISLIKDEHFLIFHVQWR